MFCLPCCSGLVETLHDFYRRGRCWILFSRRVTGSRGRGFVMGLWWCAQDRHCAQFVPETVFARQVVGRSKKRSASREAFS